VGTATMPTFGGNGGPHMEMGNGALVSYQLISPIDRNPFNDPIPGPNAIVLRLRPESIEPSPCGRSTPSPRKRATRPTSA
jgi:hypothetical protein